jgi:phage-related protein (TIGR01555 family)
MTTVRETVRQVQTSLGEGATHEAPRYDEALDRLDGFLNSMSGFGTASDRSSYTSYQNESGTLNSDAIESLFRNDDLARRMISLRPIEATRQGFVVECSEDVDIDVDVKRLGVVQCLQQAMIWARAYGGSIVVVGVRDGLPASEPVADNAIQAIDWLMTIPCNRVTKGDTVNDLASPLFGRPSWYDITVGTVRQRIHASRVVEFAGTLTPEKQRAQQGGWDDSVLQCAYAALKSFNVGFGAVGTMLTEANQGVISIDGLIDMLAERSGDRIQRRLALMNLTRGVAKALFLDAAAEKYENHELSFNGVALVLDRLMMRLSAAVEIPVTILMGRSPAGENATGESDFRWFYDSVRTEQATYLEPRLRDLLRFIFLTRFRSVPDYVIHFNSLWQETNKERADREYIEAQRDAVYMDRAVIAPEQVAIGRFAESSSFAIDREQMLERLAVASQTDIVRLEVTPTDRASVTTADEVRQSQGLSPWPNAIEGAMPLPMFKAMQDAKIRKLFPQETATPSDTK